LTTKGVDYRAINYLEEPLSVDALKQLLCSAGLTPQDALRKNEGVYRQHVAGQNLSDDQLVRVMADYPELIQRPIVTRGDKAVLARPVERLAELGIGFESER
jgi:arsenate reductase (glutaredoxin)